MKKTIILFAIIIGLVIAAGCAQPTTQPSVQPTGQTASPTMPAGQAPTVTATPVPGIAPFPGDYTHSLYGHFMDTGYIRTTRPAEWRSQPISAAGEVNVITKANDTVYTGYMQADGSYLVDGIPTGNDIKIVSVKLYREGGSDVTIAVNSEWQPFNPVAQRTQTDIG
ncbi:MAG TPA: hypothetical protein VGJ92_07565 [Methanocella sp.]|jgi:hypothetical protein